MTRFARTTTATPRRLASQRVVAAGAVTALVAGMITVFSVVAAPTASAAAALLCDQNTIYGLNASNELTAINVNTGATTNITAVAPTNNALGISNQGLDSWSYASGGAASTIVHYSTASGTSTTLANVDASAPTTMIRGAVNPATGIYYYGSNGSSAYLGAYDTGSVSGTPGPIGQVGTITGLTAPNGLGNGDFAFSSQGLMFVVVGNQIRRVDDSTPPRTPGNQTLTTTAIATLGDTVNSPGITFASSGYLYVSSGSTLIKLDPSNGSQVATVTMAGSYAPSDLGSCTYPNTITVKKNVVARAAATDQFALSVVGGNITTGNAGTTSGTATGEQPIAAGAVLVTPASTYTFSETASGTTNLANYTSRYSCVNVNTGNTLVPSTVGTSDSVLFPSPSTPDGIDVVCTFVNTAKPSVSVATALSGSRVNAGDQFTVAIRSESATGPVLNSTTNSTTAGSGATVTGGSTGTYIGAAGSTYYVTENPAGTTNFVQYSRLISCTDSNGLQTGLPTAQPFSGSLAITVVDGAQISCTVTNAPAAATLTVNAALITPRAVDGDQFTVAVRTGSASGPVVSPTTNSTTAGTGSTITPGSGTTGAYTAVGGAQYFLTESIAGPGAGVYGSSIACTDANGLQTGLPNGTFTGSQTITPVAGAAITCTVTNAGRPSSQSLVKTNPAQLLVGTPSNYTLTVTNDGGFATTGSQVLDKLPANVQFNSASGTGWSCAVSGTVAAGQLLNCIFSGSIAPLASSSFQVTVTPLAATLGTSVQNRASVNVLDEMLADDPTACTATGTPAGCAVAPLQSVPRVTANPDTATTAPGVAVITGVLANDTVTPAGTTLDPASVAITTNPGHGSTTVNTGNGAIKYTPAAGFSGVDVYSYRVCNNSAPTPICATSTVTVTVPNVVIAVDDTVTTAQNTLVTTGVLSNDTVSTNGAPLNPASVTITDQPDHGGVVINPATGEVTYTPDAGYSGPDSYRYQVCDTSTPTPVCDPATVSITVGGNVVTAGNDTDTTAPATAISTDVRSNDSSSTGQPLATPTVTGQPSHGTAAVDPATGSIVYTPVNGFSGTDSYPYRVCDTSNPTPVCSTATVTINVPNTVTATGDAATTAQNAPVTTTVLANDTVLPGAAALNPASVTVQTAPAHGSTSVNGSTGAITYTPDNGYSGPDNYTYRVCDLSTPTPVCAVGAVTVSVGSNTVIATDDTDETAPGTPVGTDVRANDSSSTNQPLADPTVTAQPGHGTAAVDPTTGLIVYTPAIGFSGIDSYQYAVCDTSTPTPVCATATVTITVPNTVTAVDDTVSTPQNTAAVTPVLGNDTVTENGAPLNPASVVLTDTPDHGSTSVNAETGTITYTPAGGYSGPDSYSYQVCDTSAPTPVCDSATVTITVGANTVAANPDSTTTTPGAPVTTDVRLNDSTGTGQPLANPTVTTTPGHGTATVDPITGEITYTPEPGFSGTDSYGYTVCDTSDPAPVCGSATVTVQVPNVVVAVDDIAATPQNTPAVTPVLGNDTISPNGSPLDPAGVEVVEAPAHGDTSVDPATGTITYTPDNGYSGPDSYSYRVCDSSLPTPVCDTAIVTISVGTNTVVATPDNVTTPPGTATTIDVLDNDSSSTGQPLTNPTITVEPGHGTVTVSPDGTITYTPNPNSSGTDTFTYQVCDTSNPTPVCSTETVTIQLPTVVTAVNDTGASAQNTPVTTAVLANDTVTANAAPLDPASVSVTTGPPNGTTTVDTETGSVTYTPNSNFSGVDTYSYRVCDSSTPTPQCAAAVVTITVGSNDVLANDDDVSTAPATPITVDVLANDTKSSTGAALDPASVTVTSGPSFGTVAVDPATGAISYTPNSGSSGVDSFDYRVCDATTPTPVCATATVTVSVPNVVTAVDNAFTTPQNTLVRTTVLGNDTITAGGSALNPASVTVPVAALHGGTVVDPSTGDVLYTPAAGYSGSDSFRYRVCDSSAPTPVCATALVTVTIPANTVLAVDDSDTTAPLTPVTTNVLFNDSVTADGAPLDPGSVVVTIEPAHGTTAVDPATGDVTYTPGSGFSGIDAYTYQVCDTSIPERICATATVTITVATVVVALSDIAATPQNTPVRTPVLANDSVSFGAAPLNPASVAVQEQPEHGTAAVDPETGDITYTPSNGFSGPDSYRYRVCDTSAPTPVCATATVAVSVGTNTVAADPDAATTEPATPVRIDVRFNDSTSTGQQLAIPTVSTPAGHGSTVVDPETGDITYTPQSGFSGTDVFQYIVCDTSNPTPVCDTASVVVQVPSPFQLLDDESTTPQNAPVVTAVLANDTITTGGSPLDPASVTTSDPAHGSTTVNPETGAVTYTPDPNYSGPDSYTYTVCDTSIPTPVCGTATVVITVQPNTVTAGGDTGSTLQGTPVTIDVLAGDAAGTGGAPLDPGSVTVPTGPAHGTVTVDPATGAITYTPEAGYSGPDSFDYQVCDTSAPTPVCATATVDLTVLRTGLGFLKSAAIFDTNGDGVTSVGDTITYSFSVTNIGEVPATGITVVDPTAGETSCPVDELQPGESVECVAVNGHVITAADAAAGGVSNSAYVVAANQCPDLADGANCGTAVEVQSGTGTVVTPVSGDAQLVASKNGTWIDVDNNGQVNVGDQVSWEITVTNPGSAPVTGLQVTDPTAGTVTCASTTVAPGAVVLCTVAPHEISSADVDAASVRNTATATGIGPGGEIASLPATAIVKLPVPDNLAYTGVALGDNLRWALLLTLVGAAMVFVGKRRRNDGMQLL